MNHAMIIEHQFSAPKNGKNFECNCETASLARIPPVCSYVYHGINILGLKFRRFTFQILSFVQGCVPTKKFC